jgi:hypothetical protein
MGLALVVLIALVAFAALTYNSLARLRLLASNAWADIDVQLKRRHDLIPTLVATVKGHAGYEKGTRANCALAPSRTGRSAGSHARHNPMFSTRLNLVSY